jgi:hypothetical protein
MRHKLEGLGQVTTLDGQGLLALSVLYFQTLAEVLTLKTRFLVQGRCLFIGTSHLFVSRRSITFFMVGFCDLSAISHQYVSLGVYITVYEGFTGICCKIKGLLSKFQPVYSPVFGLSQSCL